VGATAIFRKQRALGYVRVSIESENIENQVLEIERFAEDK